RHPVAFQARFSVRVYDEDLGSSFLGVVEIFRRARLIIGAVCADEDDEIGANPIGVGTGGRGAADCSAQPGGAGCMANTCAGIDVVGANEAGNLLMGVVRLVSEAARGEVPGKSLRIDVAQLLSDRSNCLIPGNSTESFVAFVANHRYSQASEFPQRFFC